MNVAVITKTRDRLEYTKHCFATLKEKSGHSYDHIVVDNGSQDGTAQWLAANQEEFAAVHLSPRNLGIAGGTRWAQELLKTASDPYDLVVLMDNDCEVVSDDILAAIVGMDVNDFWLLSPRVEGIAHQPGRKGSERIMGHQIGLVDHVGCLFMVMTYNTFAAIPITDTGQPGYGADGLICHYHRSQGKKTGYIEDLVVNHYDTTDGQITRYPEYWQRKMEENGWL